MDSARAVLSGRSRLSASASASRICLGTAQLGLDYGIANSTGRPDDKTCEAIVFRALECGVSQFDTARAYGDAERRLGRILAKHPHRNEVQIVSKLQALPSDLPHDKMQDWVTSEINDSLDALGVEYLAAWLVHDPETMAQGGSALWDAMTAQLDRGVTRRVGVSVYDEAELRAAFAGHELTATQVPLNLLDHRFVKSGILDEAVQRGVTIYARSSLLQGLLTMPLSRLPVELVDASPPLQQLHNMLRGYRVSSLDVALPWILSHPQVDFVVIGVDNVSQLDDNLARAAAQLPDGLAEQLQQTFTNVPVELLEPRRWIKRRTP